MGGYRSCSFDCKTGSHSHHGYVSRSPPIIPDGQISQVRFETSAILRGPSQMRERFKRWFVYAPAFPGLPLGLVSRPTCGVAPVLSSRPPILTRKPPSVLSPFAQLWCYLGWGDVKSISSEGVTPRSSLLRAHVPLPLGSLLLQHLGSLEESSQVVPSPCCPRELPPSGQLETDQANGAGNARSGK